MNEQHDDHLLELCSGKAAWQVVPRGIERCDLDEVSERIEAAGWNCTMRNRLCHTFSGEANLTLFPSGKLLVKSKDVELARRLARIHVDEWLAQAE